MKNLLDKQCKKGFEIWFKNVYCNKKYRILKWFALRAFYRNTFLEQSGVYVEFFYCMKYLIEVKSDANFFTWNYTIYTSYYKPPFFLITSMANGIEGRKEGLHEAIKKVNEIYNENFK